MLKSILREPLVHFLLLGAALFALDAWLRPTAATAANTEIVVSEARVRNLAQNFRRTWQRPPTREELDGLVESHVREEVLVPRGARARTRPRRHDHPPASAAEDGVHLEEAAALAKPTDEELNAYLKANAEAFRSEPRVTFVQVYLDPRKRASTIDAEARRLLDSLNRAGTNVDPAKAGDRLLLLEARYENMPQAEVARLFGSGFAEALVKQPVGQWVGPIPSGYGVHVVRLEALQPGGTPALDDVRPLVEREWANARRQELAKAFYDKLRAKYAIKVQMPEAGKP